MGSILLVIIATGLAVLAGLVASTGSTMLVGAFGGFLMAVFLIFSPSLLFGSTLIFSMAIAGLAEFYLGIGQANWLPSLLGFALFPAALLVIFGKKKSAAMNSPLHGIGWLIGGYLVIMLLSSVLNANPFVQVLVGVRGGLPFLGVFLALQIFANSDKELKRWVLALLLVGLVQFPFCLHQALFIAPMRSHSLAAVGGGAEAIVGTFGGNQLGGGYTGEMAVFVMLASLLSVALAPYLRHGKALAWMMCLGAVGCIALAETKIIFVLTPVALLMVFYEEVRSSPKRMVGLLLAGGLVIGGLAAVYFKDMSPERLWHAWTYSFDPNFMVDRLHRGRIASLIHWWDNNLMSADLLGSLLGHGIASTVENSRMLGDGSAVKLFGLGLNSNGASALLWDFGLLGFGFLCWILVRTGWNAHRLVKVEALPEFHRAVMTVVRAMMFCFAAMLPYQISILGGAPMQFLFWFFVGYVEFWRRQASKDRPCASVPFKPLAASLP